MRANSKRIPPEWLELIRRGDREAVIWALVLEGRGGLNADRRRPKAQQFGRKFR